MATKAVCVLKGDGKVQGTIYFEQKARAGVEAGGDAVPSHLCPGAGRASGRPRHAPAAPGHTVGALRALCPAAVLHPCAAGRARPRSAESPGEPGGGGGGDAWQGCRGVQGGPRCGCQQPRAREGGENARAEGWLVSGSRLPPRRP